MNSIGTGVKGGLNSALAYGKDGIAKVGRTGLLGSGMALSGTLVFTDENNYTTIIDNIETQLDRFKNETVQKVKIYCGGPSVVHWYGIFQLQTCWVSVNYFEEGDCCIGVGPTFEALISTPNDKMLYEWTADKKCKIMDVLIWGKKWAQDKYNILLHNCRMCVVGMTNQCVTLPQKESDSLNMKMKTSI
jgi:hypothetical protein